MLCLSGPGFKFLHPVFPLLDVKSTDTGGIIGHRGRGAADAANYRLSTAGIRPSAGGAPPQTNLAERSEVFLHRSAAGAHRQTLSRTSREIPSSFGGSPARPENDFGAARQVPAMISCRKVLRHRVGVCSMARQGPRSIPSAGPTSPLWRIAPTEDGSCVWKSVGQELFDAFSWLPSARRTQRASPDRTTNGLWVKRTRNRQVHVFRRGAGVFTPAPLALMADVWRPA